MQDASQAPRHKEPPPLGFIEGNRVGHERRGPVNSHG